MEQAALPPHAEWETRAVVIVCDMGRDAGLLARHWRNTRATHFGAHAGFLGTIAGEQYALAVADASEGSAYAALRHLHYLFRPALAVHVSYATGVCESLHAGDLAIVESTRRIYVPHVIIENMFENDDFVFSSDRQREHVLNAPTLRLPDGVRSRVETTLAPSTIPNLVQSKVQCVKAGSGLRDIPAWRGSEFLSWRFGVDAIDATSYGFFLAAQHLELPFASLLVANEGLSGKVKADFVRYRRRFLGNVSEAVEQIVPVLLAETLLRES